MTETLVKRRAVALDLDGVCIDFIKTLLFIHNKLYNTAITEKQVVSWDLNVSEDVDLFGQILKNKTLDKTFKDYEAEIYTLAPAYMEAKHAIEIYRQLGLDIIFITARSEKFKKQTEINLFWNHMLPNKLIFSEKKSEELNRLAEKYDIVLFADDSIVNVRDVNNNCKNVKNIILINKLYNEKAKVAQNIIRCENLLETIKYLTKKDD